jgi:predicted RNase H-related nuclease YkuK (DUF458 family)
MKNNLFNSYAGLKLTSNEVVEEVIAFMRANPNNRYKVMIGTDSLRYNETDADFVTAIVVHRIGNGGRYFWRREELGGFHTLRDRILREVMMSLDIAKSVVGNLKDRNTPEFDFEIHVDVGVNGETKIMIQELVGMIRANNFEARTKPESYAASSVADRCI